MTVIRRPFVTDLVDFRYLTGLLLGFIKCFARSATMRFARSAIMRFARPATMRFARPATSIDDQIENQPAS